MPRKQLKTLRLRKPAFDFLHQPCPDTPLLQFRMHDEPANRARPALASRPHRPGQPPSRLANGLKKNLPVKLGQQFLKRLLERRNAPILVQFRLALVSQPLQFQDRRSSLVALSIFMLGNMGASHPFPQATPSIRFRLLAASRVALFPGLSARPRHPSPVAKSPAFWVIIKKTYLTEGVFGAGQMPVSQDGYVPIYANLYASKGLLLGWINLDLTNAAGVSLTWIRPGHASGLYTNGFTNVLLTDQILLSQWINPPAIIFAATNLSFLDTINDTNALLDFAVMISNNYKLGKVSGPAPLSGSINPKTGLLKVTIGSGANKTNGYGAILLDGTNGGGYFLTKTNAGAVILKP